MTRCQRPSTTLGTNGTGEPGNARRNPLDLHLDLGEILLSGGRRGGENERSSYGCEYDAAHVESPGTGLYQPCAYLLTRSSRA